MISSSTGDDLSFRYAKKKTQIDFILYAQPTYALFNFWLSRNRSFLLRWQNVVKL